MILSLSLSVNGHLRTLSIISFYFQAETPQAVESVEQGKDFLSPGIRLYNYKSVTISATANPAEAELAFQE